MSSFQESGGDLLVERRRINDGGSGSRKSDRSTTSAAAAAAALAAYAATSAGSAAGNNSNNSTSTTATLHSGSWPEQAMKSCINRLGGNGCWARYCACDACKPYARRGSSASSGSGGHFDDPAPVTVTDEYLRMTYEVWGLRPSELPVKGTYIDSRIVAGFKYRVRYLGGADHHSRQVFPEPVRLRSIGAGYGKRLTFDTRQLKASTSGSNRPHCGHFWSDSCPDGYALSLVALDVGQRFSLRVGGRRASQELGRAVVTWVAPEPAECRLRLGSNAVTARVAVAFKANVSLTTCRCLLGCHDYENVPLTGLAWLERPAGPRAVAKVTRIEGVNLPDMPDLKLMPVD